MIKWLNDQGVKAVTIIDPGVKYEPGGTYSVFNEGTVHNYFLKQTNGEPYVGEVWPGKSVFVDYTMPDAAKWWGDQHKTLLDAGVSGIWNDMNEPADFLSRDGDKWKDVVNYDEGEHSKHAKMRNLFAFLECKATYEGLQRLQPDERPYVITRSGYAGIQRYATMWTGDSNATWDALALSIPMFETLGLSGESFVGADLGGYTFISDWFPHSILPKPSCRRSLRSGTLALRQEIRRHHPQIRTVAISPFALSLHRAGRSA
jgi:alpha-glucosidase